MSVPVVDNLGALIEEYAPFVHGAAVSASSDPDAVTIEVLLAAVRDARAGIRVERRALVERALVLAVERAPADAFAAMAPEDRGAVALARLAGYSVREVATALSVDAATATARMLRGLRALRATTAARRGWPAESSRLHPDTAPPHSLSDRA